MVDVDANVSDRSVVQIKSIYNLPRKYIHLRAIPSIVTETSLVFNRCSTNCRSNKHLYCLGDYSDQTFSLSRGLKYSKKYRFIVSMSVAT